MKVVINKCYGGFGLSPEAIILFVKKKYNRELITIGSGMFVEYMFEDDFDLFHDCEIKRDDEVLISVVEELGERANDSFSSLKIVEIPDGVEWEIEEYDGMEVVREVSRTWS